MSIDFRQKVALASQRIQPYLRVTPLDHVLGLSTCGVRAHVKCENLQFTGSFKARGALNKLLSLGQTQRDPSVVTASTGNHGAAVAFGANLLGVNALVFVPENASPTKIDNIRRMGAEVRIAGDDCIVTEQLARDHALARQLTYISPYNDPEVIVGQGTIGLEILQQLPQTEVVFIALGGGGLAAGIAGYLKAVAPHIITVGCSPCQAPVMYECIRANDYLDIPSLPTLSDGTAGGLEKGSITLPLCRDTIDRHVLVSEEEIKAAMLLFMEAQHQMIEGSAGVAIAGMLKLAPDFQGANAVIILCGANISADKLKTIL